MLGICAGTALASYGEINFSVLGISIMFAAEVTEAVRLVLVQYLLKVRLLVNCSEQMLRVD